MELGVHEDDLKEYEGIINTIFGSKSKVSNSEFKETFERDSNTHWFTKPAEIRLRFTRLIDDDTRNEV